MSIYIPHKCRFHWWVGDRGYKSRSFAIGPQKPSFHVDYSKYFLNIKNIKPRKQQKVRVMSKFSNIDAELTKISEKAIRWIQYGSRNVEFKSDSVNSGLSRFSNKKRNISNDHLVYFCQELWWFREFVWNSYGIRSATKDRIAKPDAFTSAEYSANNRTELSSDLVMQVYQDQDQDQMLYVI
jgi:hypothetical protein